VNELPARLLDDSVAQSRNLCDAICRTRVTPSLVIVRNCVMGVFAQNVIHYETGWRINHPNGGAPPGAVDVGPWEVKAVPGRMYGLLVSLELAELYGPETLFVLVYCKMPKYEVRGWAYGRDFLGKEELIKLDIREPGYLLPPKRLRPWPMTETKGTT
jgi:hypothetical protein